MRRNIASAFLLASILPLGIQAHEAGPAPTHRGEAPRTELRTGNPPPVTYRAMEHAPMAYHSHGTCAPRGPAYHHPPCHCHHAPPPPCRNARHGARGHGTTIVFATRF